MKPVSDMRDLLAAARADGPPVASRNAMWDRIEMSAGLVPAAAASGVRAVEQAARAPAQPSPPSPPSPPSVVPSVAVKSGAILKAGIVGGGVGSAITVIGVFAALHATSPKAEPRPTPALAIEHGAGERGEHAPSLLIPMVGPRAESTAHETTRDSKPAAATTDVDALSREVALVMGAREALLDGDGERALLLARRAREIHGQLSREALTLEMRALRALARNAEADRAEMELKVTPR